MAPSNDQQELKHRPALQTYTVPFRLKAFQSTVTSTARLDCFFTDFVVSATLSHSFISFPTVFISMRGGDF